jgi:hypothetical protein
MNLYTLKTFFFIGKQRNSIKKKRQPPLNIHGVYKKDTKTKEKQKTKKNTQKNPKDRRYPQPYHINLEPSKKPGLLYTTARALLPLTQLEPTLLTTKHDLNKNGVQVTKLLEIVT